MSKDQKQMLRDSHNREFEINRTFLEMQASEHPLTNEEIQIMAKRRPWLWERFLGMGKG